MTNNPKKWMNVQLLGEMNVHLLGEMNKNVLYIWLPVNDWNVVYHLKVSPTSRGL